MATDFFGFAPAKLSPCRLTDMSGVKRKIEDKDPDYEDIAQVQGNKRSRRSEQSARVATVQKIEAIIKEQFGLEMKNKEHEIEAIGQRLNEARRMMDKLRACIVASYYANAGMPKVSEPTKSDMSVLNHPAIKRFLESPSRSSSPLNQDSEAPSGGHSEPESPSLHGDASDAADREEPDRQERRPGRNTGKDTFGVPVSVDQQVTHHTTGDEMSRLYVKKTIVVGNVSKYIAPDKREENDQSTHKWMVYVRGSRKEPSIDHFVKKVWFFLHPSYKPNDLVEVSEPPFHLTRRGWGEFPVRVQIHFKDQRNKRIDIIHHLKLDRTYTGLQTLGAETVVDVELHRNSLGEDFIPFLSSSSSSSSSSSQRASAAAPGLSLAAQSAGQNSRHMASPSQLSSDSSSEKGVAQRSEVSRSDRPAPQAKATEMVTLGSHSNSAFQPITASCKIAAQGPGPSPTESPGKSFQPITMSCKIVSGSPVSTPSHSPLSQTPTSTPVHMRGGSSVINNPYIIVDKPGQVVMNTPTVAGAGSPLAKQSTAAQSSRSPAPKVHTSGYLSSGVKVIIKQEPGEVTTQQSPQQQVVSTATPQQPQQYVTVKGGHMITVSPQKSGVGPGGGATPSKMVGVPVTSALQSAVKQVSVSSGQILVAKSSPAVSKVMAQKQVLAQGVAKAIVSGGGASVTGSITGQQVHTVTKATGGSGTGGKSGVMATLQLPVNNLTSLPPGTKLYLTTNSKNPAGKGKLLLIPQGAILRASNTAGHQSQGSSSGSSQSSSSSSVSSGLPGNLSYTSYILKQTPQGTFLVGQPGASGKQGGTSSSGHVVSSSASVTQQAIRVTAGQKAAILAQVVGGSQGSQVKLSDGLVKTVTSAAAHLSKPGTTTLRMTGGVITATSSTPNTPASAAAPTALQPAEGASVPSTPSLSKTATQHPVLVAANQASVINAAKSSSSGVSMAKGTAPLVTVTKSLNMPVISLSKGQAGTPVVNVPKSASPSLVTAASLVGGATVSGKTAAAISGMLKLHSGQSSSQQTVLTIPATQLKQLSLSGATTGLQTLLMPVGKVQSGSKPASTALSGPTPPTSAPLAQVKTEPGVSRSSCTTPVTPTPASSTPLPTSAPATVKLEQGLETTTQELINTEHIETLLQLLTAVVKKFPLIVPEKTEDSHPFCATSVDQYYSWNIGKRRASELQRAVAVKRVVQDVLDRSPRLQALSPPKTREVVQWCRLRGYTPPDPEPQCTEEDSIEDILTQIDSEPECPSTLSDASELCQRLAQLQRILKTEPEEEEEEPLDIVTVKEVTTPRVKVKQEQEEVEPEPKYFLGSCPSAQFIRDTAEQVGVSFQPVEVEKGVLAPLLEALILKATEQFASEILREALASTYGRSPQNRAPGEISAVHVHQAISSVPTCDFLTNRYMGVLMREGSSAD
ncbi:YEATS domain-containing protein 2 isoform X2 [Electrophorus electricus]|uniref:YEATS domain-containing protein 2 isoform X2 n=1 Tax=Electrophorus electricus TaxID=8005 RepID=UPI0015CF8A6E|nr:YEATS domain-containing protein 2 isoform X2 [Electrophorus electricus]